MEEDSSILGPQVSRDHLKGLRFSCLESLSGALRRRQLQCYGKEEPWLPLGHVLIQKLKWKHYHSRWVGLGLLPTSALFQLF